MENNIIKLDGRTYEEIQPDVIKLVYYYVNLWYKNYPVLSQYGYDSERIVTDVYHGLYLKTRDDNLSNLERHFIKASQGKGFTMSYISNVIKRSVLNMLMCRARDIAKKPLVVSLEQEVSENRTLADVVVDIREPFEKQVETKIKLESIPVKTFDEYYFINNFNEKQKLTTQIILNWTIAGYSINDMRLKVFSKSNKNIGVNSMSKLKKETISIAREYLYDN